MSFKGTFESNYKQVKARIQKEFNKLTDKDFTTIEGNYEKLLSRIQEVYKISKDEATRRLEKLATSGQPTVKITSTHNRR